MKPTALLRAFLLGSALLAAPSAHASIYYWDNYRSTAAFGAASGTWLSSGTVGNATQGWSTIALGTTTPTGTITTTTTSDDINFGTITNTAPPHQSSTCIAYPPSRLIPLIPILQKP